MATTTISAAYDGEADENGATDDANSDGILHVAGASAATEQRIHFRFDLTTLPAGAEVTQVDLVIKVLADVFGSGDVRPYNTDGQANPESDSGADRFTRSGNGASYYNVFTDTPDWTGTGVKTCTLDSAAKTAVMNAKIAVNRFSLAVDATGTSATGELEALEAAGTDEPKLTLTYTRTIDVRQIHLIPYRPAPDPDLNPELALSIAGALPKIIVGTWRGEDILWHDVWTLDSANVEKLVIGRTTAANSPGPRTLYAIAADGIYYMPIGAEAHPAVAPWPLTNGTPHAEHLSGNDFDLPNHVKSVERMTFFGEHLMGSEGDELLAYTHWDGADRWDRYGPFTSFPTTITVAGKGNMLYAFWQIKDNARSALAPYVSDVKIAPGDWTDHGLEERRQSETSSPQNM